MLAQFVHEVHTKLGQLICHSFLLVRCLLANVGLHCLCGLLGLCLITFFGRHWFFVRSYSLNHWMAVFVIYLSPRCCKIFVQLTITRSCQHCFKNNWANISKTTGQTWQTSANNDNQPLSCLRLESRNRKHALALLSWDTLGTIGMMELSMENHGTSPHSCHQFKHSGSTGAW